MRKSRKNKRIIFITLIILIFLVTIICYRYISINKKSSNKLSHQSSEIEIHMIDVSQSESILIIQGKNTMLIDTGEIFYGKSIVNYILEVGIDSIDILLITHFHKDHVGGAHRIISYFNIGKIICMDSRYFSTLQERFWYMDLKIAKKVNELIYNKNIQLELPYDKNGKLKEFPFGNSKITFLSQETDTDIVNNKSIVMKITFGNFSAIFMGDAQWEVEKKLIADGINLDVNILKVGHHGSNTSSTNEFLEEVDPQYTIISCGINNNYLHPHNSVLKRITNKKDIKVYRTDLMGNILVKSDGNNIDIFTER